MPPSGQETMHTMAPPSVTILGAGIAGLTMGRCLCHRGIQAVIYDRAQSKPRHSYGISLGMNAYTPLMDVLGMEKKDFQSWLTVDSSGSNSHREPLRVNRSKLETLLREGLDIRFEHNLTSARILPGKQGIQLSFKDKDDMIAPLLVDATGVHSPLRRSLLPNNNLEVLPYAVFSGKRYISRRDFNNIYKPSFGNEAKIVRQPKHEGEPRLEISVNDATGSGKVSISYIYSRPAHANSEGVDPLHRPERANSGATDIPEEFYEELGSLLESNHGDLDDVFKDCFNVEQVRDDRLLHWLMRTILVPKDELLRLCDQGIMVIGDAAHAVPILGGDGANMAISDAIGLSDVLTAYLTDGGGRSSGILTAFYEGKGQLWKKEVDGSKISIAEMHAPSNGTASRL